VRVCEVQAGRLVASRPRAHPGRADVGRRARRSACVYATCDGLLAADSVILLPPPSPVEHERAPKPTDAGHA